MKTRGIDLIAQERQEQITKHGRLTEHDVKINQGQQLVTAAIALLETDYPDEITEGRSINHFPMDWSDAACVKMVNKPHKERLAIAGALIAAEIDRLQALEEQS